jgi:hypothetical protein
MNVSGALTAGSGVWRRLLGAGVPEAGCFLAAGCAEPFFEALVETTAF